jgi:1,2-diacylglycerol-3-alpha-glucose alpha-1,2-glucosyltransferase
MRICLYQERKNALRFSGIGKSFENLSKALKFARIDFTTDPNDKPYDILHVDSFGLKSWFLAKKEKHRGAKVVIHAHSLMEDARDSFIFSNALAPLIKQVLKLFYREADLLITVSNDAQKILKNYGLKNRIAVLSNGVDLKIYAPGKLKKYRKSFREEFGIPEKEVVIFGIGHVFFRKGIVSFTDIARKFPNRRFFWAGKQYGPWRVCDRRVRKALSHPPPNLKFLGYRKDIWNIYAGGDIFLYPSWNETQGIALIEAAASKKTILARNLPPYADFLKHGQNALLAKNDGEMAEYLEEILKNRELRNHLAENALKMSREHDLPVIGRKLKTIYQSLFK